MAAVSKTASLVRENMRSEREREGKKESKGKKREGDECRGWRRGKENVVRKYKGRIMKLSCA